MFALYSLHVRGANITCFIVGLDLLELCSVGLCLVVIFIVRGRY